jgi:hypothetical protein
VNPQGTASFVVVEGANAARIQAAKNKNEDWQDNLLVGAGQQVHVVIHSK